MELPNSLKVALDRLQSKADIKTLAKISAELSASYIKREEVGGRIVTSQLQAAVYALARMPATYGAISAAISLTLAGQNLTINSLLDVGAGTGAASWAAMQHCDIKEVTCLEREGCMADLGRELMSGSDAFKSVHWVQSDMVNGNMPAAADMVVAGYSLNELLPQERANVAAKLWESTRKVLIIVEPGTPECHRQMLELRYNMLKMGAKLLAPCTHMAKCELQGDDWCHFAARISRSKIHKILKGGSSPYEDEKYCFMAFTRDEYNGARARVLRHPIIEKERVGLRLCMAQGIIERQIKKGQRLYKFARKANAGDSIDYEDGL